MRQHLKPYAEEIGQVTISWNRLHENLCLLFWFAIGPGPVPYAIWNRLASDRTQRDILETAVKAGAFGQYRPGFADDVLWLLKQTEQLAEHRNSAIHAPLSTLTNLATGKTVVEPHDYFGNKRAKRLRGKNIIRELEWCAECADLLNYFAANLISTMNETPGSWPERPSLSLPPSS